MERITVYHNPACGNSRGALEILRERKVEVDVIEYLKAHPTREALEKIADMLDGPIADLVRKDKRFKELGLDAAKYNDKKTVVALLLEHLIDAPKRLLLLTGSDLTHVDVAQRTDCRNNPKDIFARSTRDRSEAGRTRASWRKLSFGRSGDRPDRADDAQRQK